MYLNSLIFIFNILVLLITSNNYIDANLSPLYKKIIIISWYSISITFFALNYKKTLPILKIFILIFIGFISLIFNKSNNFYFYISIIYYSIIYVFMLDLRILINLNIINLGFILSAFFSIYFLIKYFNFLYYGADVVIIPTFEGNFEKPILGFVLLIFLIISIRANLKNANLLKILPILFSMGLLGNRSTILASIFYLGTCLYLKIIRIWYLILFLITLSVGYIIHTDEFVTFTSNNINCENLNVTNIEMLCGKALINNQVKTDSDKIAADILSQYHQDLSSLYLRGGKSVSLNAVTTPDIPRLSLWMAFVENINEIPLFGYGVIGSYARNIPIGFSDNPEKYPNTLLHNFILQSINDFGLILFFCFIFYFFVNFKFSRNDLRNFLSTIIPFGVFFFFQNGFSIYMLTIQSLIFVWMVISIRN